jgi:hypothetical protein
MGAAVSARACVWGWGGGGGASGGATLDGRVRGTAK